LDEAIYSAFNDFTIFFHESADMRIGQDGDRVVADGRQSFTPFGVTTMGQSMRIGCSSMKLSTLMAGPISQLVVWCGFLAQQISPRHAHRCN
jgi:hypothetical protein